MLKATNQRRSKMDFVLISQSWVVQGWEMDFKVTTNLGHFWHFRHFLSKIRSGSVQRIMWSSLILRFKSCLQSLGSLLGLLQSFLSGNLGYSYRWPQLIHGQDISTSQVAVPPPRHVVSEALPNGKRPHGRAEQQNDLWQSHGQRVEKRKKWARQWWHWEILHAFPAEPPVETQPFKDSISKSVDCILVMFVQHTFPDHISSYWLAQINAYHATLCLLLVCPRYIILFNTWKLVSTSKHQILLHGSLSNRACEKMLKMLKDVKSLFESVVFSAFLLRANHVGGLQNLPFDPVDPPWFPARQGLAGALSFRWSVLPKAAAQHTASYQECKKHSDAWSWEVGNNPLSSEAWTWSVIMIIFGGRGKHAMGPQFVNECIAFALLCRSADCDVLWICLDTAYKAYIQPILWAGSGFGTLSPWLQLGWPRGVHLGASTWMWTWKPVILLKSGAKHFPEVKATNRWDTHLFVRKTFPNCSAGNPFPSGSNALAREP